jgi:Archaeal fructose-1,6-bisphosphatase and related enzymes of inositol monophosphatase family
MTEFEAFALELAAIAATPALAWFRKGPSVDNKLDPATAFDPVTQADREVEAALRTAIALRYPDHGVIGEEYGADRPDADYVWVLDPIDGTRAYIAGIPLWTSLIGLIERGQPYVGAIAQPWLDETYIGGPSGAFLHGRGDSQAIRCRSLDSLNQAIIATTSPDIFTGAELGAWTQVRAAARLTRYGCDAYAYALLAAGQIDLVAESGLKLWDYAALIPVIEAAGGAVSNWRGEAVDGSGQILAVGDARIRPQALVTLKRAAL